MPCTNGKVIAGVAAPLGIRFALAENEVKLSVDKDVPLLGSANSSRLMDHDLRAQLCRREDQRLDSDRVDVKLNWVCSCIWSVGSKIWLDVRNAETIRECIPTALAPK